MFAFHKLLKWLPVLLCSVLLLPACNKEYDDVDLTDPVINKPGPTGTVTLAEILNSDTAFSFLKAAVAKAGLGAVLGNANSRLTIFAPDNDAFRRSGIPSEAVITSVLDAATVSSLVRYHLVPDYMPAEAIPTTFPNIEYPTYLNPAPQISELLRLTIFPSKRAHGAWVNNIPITAVNTQASNGVLHRVAALVAPPSKSMLDIISADSTLTYLVAALNRADSGHTTIADGSLIAAASSFGPSLTLFAPDNNAFRQLLMAMGLPQSPAVFGALPVSTVRGLIAYHLLGQRVFSVNMPTTPTFVPTLLNAAVPAHPGVNLVATFTGPFVTAISVTGVANGGASAQVTQQDMHAYNGIIHKINRVLLPQ